MKEAQFLSAIILESPLLAPILDAVPDKYEIGDLDPTKDPYEQRLLEDMEREQPVDWNAVGRDLDAEIRGIPDLLPPEIAPFQKILEFRQKLAGEPNFTEPITERFLQATTSFTQTFGTFHRIPMTYRRATAEAGL